MLITVQGVPKRKSFVEVVVVEVKKEKIILVGCSITPQRQCCSLLMYIIKVLPKTRKSGGGDHVVVVAAVLPEHHHHHDFVLKQIRKSHFYGPSHAFEGFLQEAIM